MQKENNLRRRPISEVIRMIYQALPPITWQGLFLIGWGTPPNPRQKAKQSPQLPQKLNYRMGKLLICLIKFGKLKRDK
jgi:hypothetical protein